MKLFSLEAEKRRHKLMVKDDYKRDKLNGDLGGSSLTETLCVTIGHRPI
jgi:hypothetical protein